MARYLDVTNGFVIDDRALNRRIPIKSCGSESVVVSNPWVTILSRISPSLDDADSSAFICVETTNAATDALEVCEAKSKITIPLSRRFYSVLNPAKESALNFSGDRWIDSQILDSDLDWPHGWEMRGLEDFRFSILDWFHG